MAVKLWLLGSAALLFCFAVAAVSGFILRQTWLSFYGINPVLPVRRFVQADQTMGFVSQ